MASEAESENFKEVDEFASKDRPVVMNVHPSLFVKPAIEKLNVWTDFNVLVEFRFEIACFFKSTKGLLFTVFSQREETKRAFEMQKSVSMCL